MKRITTHNRWIAMLWHTILAIVMMQVCRLLYFFYNQSFFPSVDTRQLLSLMQGGYIMDMVSIGFGFILYYLMMIAGAFLPAKVEMNRWYTGIRHFAYWLPFTLFLFLNVSDTGYYPFVLRRANADVFYEFQGKSVIGFYKDFIIDFWPLTLAFFLILAGGILCYYLLKFSRDPKQKPNFASNFITSILVVIFLFFSMRGRWDLRGMPQSMLVIAPYFTDFDQLPIIYNTPFTLSQQPSTHREYHFFDQKEVAELIRPFYQAAPLADNDSLFGSFKGRNVMVILLESMAKEYIGYLNKDIEGYESYTPFLDSLIPNTLYAKYGFASGKRSVESFPAVFVSLPSFGGTFNDSDFQMENYQHFSSYDTGLPLSLKNAGYHLKFYHGDVRGGMGFFPFLHKLGVEEQYTFEDYIDDYGNNPEDRTSGWGIHDLPFEQAMIKDMKNLKEPFGALFFSLSNHTPFKLPVGFKGNFKKGTLPIHKTAQYADLALKEFFEKAKEQPWFKNTLFVITADHTNQSDNPAYRNKAGHAAAPILFYDPQGRIKGCVDDYVIQHTDILPTLLYLLGIEDPILCYGSNIFDKDAKHIALNFFNGQYILFTKEITAVLTPDEQVKVTAPVPYLQTEPSKAVMPSEKVQEYYSRLLKAIVQDYNHRIYRTSFSINELLAPSDSQTNQRP